MIMAVQTEGGGVATGYVTEESSLTTFSRTLENAIEDHEMAESVREAFRHEGLMTVVGDIRQRFHEDIVQYLAKKDIGRFIVAQIEKALRYSPTDGFKFKLGEGLAEAEAAAAQKKIRSDTTLSFARDASSHRYVRAPCVATIS